MRLLIARSVLALFAVVATSSAARADFIPIGTVSYQDGILSLTNQTGDFNSQSSDFPVLDFVDFTSIFLTVDGSELNPGDELVDALAGDDPADDGYNFDSAPFGNAPLSVMIGGSVANAIVQLFGQGAFDIGGSVFMCVVSPAPCGGGVGEDLNGGANAVEDGALGIIYVNGRKVVPEPMTLSLFAAGLAGVAIRRRRAARR